LSKPKLTKSCRAEEEEEEEEEEDEEQLFAAGGIRTPDCSGSTGT